MTSSVVGSACVLWGGLGGDGGYVEMCSISTSGHVSGKKWRLGCGSESRISQNGADENFLI